MVPDGKTEVMLRNTISLSTLAHRQHHICALEIQLQLILVAENIYICFHLLLGSKYLVSVLSSRFD